MCLDMPGAGFPINSAGQEPRRWKCGLEYDKKLAVQTSQKEPWMAKSLLALVVGAILLAGCQKKTSMIDPLPAPNLDGPVVARPAQPTAPPRTAAPASTATAAKPKPRPGGVPEDWVPSATPNAWRWIVVHHSATPAGNATTMDRAHRAKGWDELGYHFVIGNGTNSGDGQIEVGPRWPKQKWGAHAKTPDQQFNNYGIGICLVGNFDIDRPTPAQMQALSRLTSYLMHTYHIPISHVIGHSDTKPTDCPGRNMSVATLRRMAGQLAEDTSPLEPAGPGPTASAELLMPAAR
jgi:hypothetical protein